MKESQLKSVIKKQLSFFNNHNVEITDDTVTEEVLSDDSLNQRKLFRGNVLWSIWNAGAGKKKFPSNWLSLSVSDLASKLLILFMLLVSTAGFSQVTVKVGAVKTDLKQSAIQIGFSYLKSLDSAIGGEEFMGYGKRSWFMITPDIDFKAGTQDAFSSITAKATGLLVKFKTTTVDGIETPDADKVLHSFPISIGAETNDRFDFANGIVEFGYVPFYQSATAKVPDWIKHTKLGVYLQGGYKFGLDSSSTVPIGGEVDQSLEQVHSKLFRAKGAFSIDTKEIIKLDAFKIGVVGNSNLWYDFVNKATYYKLEGIARVYLTPTIYFDVQYSKGSGAPNFNEGDQWGAGLSIQF
jgi:hypothetical protein